MPRKKVADMTEEQKQNRLKYNRNWRANRTEEQKQRDRNSERKYWANRTEEQKKIRTEKQRQYRANLPKEVKQQKAEQLRERMRKRWANMTEERKKEINQVIRKARANRTEEEKERAARRMSIHGVRHRCKKQGIPFNLTLDHLNEIWPDDNKCRVFGVPFVRGEGAQCPTSPALDRIEPAKGYTIGNVQVISSRANVIKTDATAAEVMIVAQYLLKKERERAST